MRVKTFTCPVANVTVELFQLYVGGTAIVTQTDNDADQIIERSEFSGHQPFTRANERFQFVVAHLPCNV